MDDRVMQFRVGVMVLATLIIVGILVILFEEELPFRRLWQEPYTIYVKFKETRGVSQGTSIYKSGIHIGKVKKVELVEDDSAVLVTAEILEKFKIYEHEECQVVSDLLGDTSLTFVSPDKKPPSKVAVAAKTVLLGKISEDPTGLISALQKPISKVQDTGNELGKASRALKQAADQFTKFLEDNDTKIADALDNANKALTSVGKAADNANQVIGEKDIQENLKQSLRELPGTLNEMKEAMRLARRSLENIESFTEPLAKDSQGRVARIDHVINQLGTVLNNLTEFTQSMKKDGSLGRLIEDPELYNHLNRAAKNMDEVSQRLKPIVEDVRVFTDKIARHPELIGLRGAMERSSGLK